MFIEIGDTLINLAEVIYVRNYRTPNGDYTVFGFKGGGSLTLRENYSEVIAKIKEAMTPIEPDFLTGMPCEEANK